jgi:hypothetical protein
MADYEVRRMEGIDKEGTQDEELADVPVVSVGDVNVNGNLPHHSERLR